MTTNSDPTALRPRPLGLCSAVALIVASMIGTGVFTTSGFLLADLGSRHAVLTVWAAGGVVALLGALSYGALARRLPESGGEYLFLSRTLHPAAGYVAGWISLLVGFSAPLAAAAVGFGEYTSHWWPQFAPRATGTALIVLFGAIHCVHVQRGAWVQNAAVLVKLALLLMFVGFGAARLAGPMPEPASAPAPLSAFGLALVWVSFSYSGWNAAVYIGGEIRDPERNLPRSLVIGTAVVTLLYVALNAVFVFSAPVATLSGQLEVGRIAAQALGGVGCAEAVTALIALALATSVSSLVMTGPRVYARMAADGTVPQWLKTGVGPPRAAIALQVAVSSAMVWTATYESLLTYIGFTLGLSTAATVAALMVLRRREGPCVHVPGWPWVPGAFVLVVLATTALALQLRPAASLAGLGTIALAWLAWTVQRRIEK
ncbi:MAG: amino acid permease [Deltaproteobacteria bacterium]|nr:amino acid permease [Deltaproteobacteria bacterium]